MNLDPDNPVVKRCAEGMQAEFAGRPDEAKRLFASAWESRSDDLEATIAAHYVARHADSLEEALRWNTLALEHAQRLPADTVRAMLPSLYLNLGKSHEDLGASDEARRWYTRASEVLDALGGDRYGDLVRDAVERALSRVRTP